MQGPCLLRSPACARRMRSYCERASAGLRRAILFAHATLCCKHANFIKPETRPRKMELRNPLTSLLLITAIELLSPWAHCPQNCGTTECGRFDAALMIQS
jgi:hypothetical protein